MRGWSEITSCSETPRSNGISPERELLIAVLDRAVLDYCGREGELHERAKEWIFGPQDEDNLFSFSSICHYLSIDINALRARIKTLNIPKGVSQAHRWLRRKVQSEKTDSSRYC